MTAAPHLLEGVEHRVHPSAPDGVRRVLAAVPPASGAVVMGTGIESVALRLAGHAALSEALMWLAVAAWLVLAGVLAARFGFHRSRLRAEARTPGALTGVAGTCVLGARLTLEGARTAGVVLLLVGALAWGALQVAVWRHRRTPAVGASFLVTVSTVSLAVLCAALANAYRAGWLVVAGTGLLVLGLVLYAVVLVRFDLRQVLTGHGDQWVAGGALAIGALACANLALAARALGDPAGVAAPLRTASLPLAVAALVWVPVLVAGELARPRPAYDVRRWSTVFPVAMLAAMAFAVGRLRAADALTDFAEVWVWVGLAVWAVVSAGMVVRGARLLSSG